MDSNQLHLIKHLSELRSRLIKILFILGLGFISCYFFSGLIVDIISQPIKPHLPETGGQLIFTSPFEKFLSYLRVSFFAGVFISCPFWLYQVWKFISPGLHGHERKWSFIFVTLSSLLFLSGILFVYFVVYPLSFAFLLNFGGEELAYISLKAYLSFFLRTAFAFAIVFELPLVLFILLKLNIISVGRLKKSRPYLILGIAVLSALITPPDIFSMLFMMLPLYLLFETSLLLSHKIVKSS